jgi:hypothetical protein
VNPHATQCRPERSVILVESPTIIVWSTTSDLLEFDGVEKISVTANTPPTNDNHHHTYQPTASSETYDTAASTAMARDDVRCAAKVPIERYRCHHAELVRWATRR